MSATPRQQRRPAGTIVDYEELERTLFPSTRPQQDAGDREPLAVPHSPLPSVAFPQGSGEARGSSRSRSGSGNSGGSRSRSGSSNGGGSRSRSGSGDGSGGGSQSGSDGHGNDSAELARSPSRSPSPDRDAGGVRPHLRSASRSGSPGRFAADSDDGGAFDGECDSPGGGDYHSPGGYGSPSNGSSYDDGGFYDGGW